MNKMAPGILPGPSAPLLAQRLYKIIDGAA